MITMISLLSPCKKIIIDYFIAIYFIPVTHLFCNWKFVLLHCCHSVAQSCLTLCSPMDCSMLGYLSFAIYQSLLKLTVPLNFSQIVQAILLSSVNYLFVLSIYDCLCFIMLILFFLRFHK